MNAYGRSCNYLALGMIRVRDNSLLKEFIKSQQVKHRE
ncbi:hypothetical protein [Tolypothrix tenuis]